MTRTLPQGIACCLFANRGTNSRLFFGSVESAFGGFYPLISETRNCFPACSHLQNLCPSFCAVVESRLKNLLDKLDQTVSSSHRFSQTLLQELIHPQLAIQTVSLLPEKLSQLASMAVFIRRP